MLYHRSEGLSQLLPEDKILLITELIEKRNNSRTVINPQKGKKGSRPDVPDFISLNQLKESLLTFRRPVTSK